jgi:anti-sigma B factor antagonist
LAFDPGVQVCGAVDDEIDLAHIERLRAAGQQALTSGALGLAVDLAALTFIDSTAVGTLVALHNLAVGHGKAFVLTNPSAPVRRVLDLTSLDQLLELVEVDRDRC